MCGPVSYTHLDVYKRQGIHSVNTTTALTEIPIAKSKADFVLINGKAVVLSLIHILSF